MTKGLGLRITRGALLAAVFWIAFCRPTSAAASWTSIGPYGGNIQAFAAAPSSPGTLYASATIYSGIEAALFRSTDGGSTWSRTNATGTLSTALAVDPASPATVYSCSGTSISRTTDAGITWQPVDTGFPNFYCGSVIVVPGTPSTVYLGGPGVVAKSTDNGASWKTTTVGSSPSLIISLAAAPGSTTLYAGSYEDFKTGGIYRTSDAGATWTALTNGIGRPLVESIEISRSNSSILWASTSLGFFRSPDGGDSWVRRLASSTAGTVAIDPLDPVTIFVATGFPGGFFVTHDDGFSWMPAGISGSVHTLDFDSGSPSVLYAGGDLGVYRSDDRGKTWMLAVQGMDGLSVHPIAAPPWAPGTVWATAGGREYSSADRGTHWEPLLQSPRDTSNVLPPVVRFVFDASSTGTAYAATTQASASSVYKTTDAGASWSATGPTPALQSPLGNEVALTIDPLDSRILYFTASGFFLDVGAASTFKSMDAGASWMELTAPALATLAIDPTAPATIYGGANINLPPDVFHSTDGGLTWSDLPGSPGGIVHDLTVAGGSPATIWAAAELGLYRSTDSGATWSAASYGIPLGFGVYTVLVDPRFSRVLYAGTAGGVYRSTDGGDTWLPLGTLPRSVLSLALDPGTLTLYAGTDAAAYRLSLGDADTGNCSPSSTSLCLDDGRFRAEVEWKTADGADGAGRVFPLTGDAGAFWFFSANNLELAIKVVDGRAFNGRFWVFGGQLTDVEYMLTITDTATGAIWTHHNAPSTLASFADTNAFGP